jgi:FkbM family methyltransferase
MQKVNPLKQILKLNLFRIYYFFTSIPIPFPGRLAWGDWWLSWGDALGRSMRTGAYEGAETQLLKKILKSGMVMMDAGAHRGYYTLLASSLLGRGGRVISFEPSPRERQWLWMHRIANARWNVQIEKSALGAKEETKEFFITLGKQTGCNSLRYPKGVLYSLPIRVRVDTLDRYYRESRMKRLDFIKMDVEGAEKEVLLGGKECLQKARPLIMCELSDIRTLRWKYRPVETVNILEHMDYSCYFIQPNCRLEPHEEKPVYEDNILAIPKEKRDAFQEFL